MFLAAFSTQNFTVHTTQSLSEERTPTKARRPHQWRTHLFPTPATSSLPLSLETRHYPRRRAAPTLSPGSSSRSRSVPPSGSPPSTTATAPSSSTRYRPSSWMASPSSSSPSRTIARARSLTLRWLSPLSTSPYTTMWRSRTPSSGPLSMLVRGCTSEPLMMSRLGLFWCSDTAVAFELTILVNN